MPYDSFEGTNVNLDPIPDPLTHRSSPWLGQIGLDQAQYLSDPEQPLAQLDDFQNMGSGIAEHAFDELPDPWLAFEDMEMDLNAEMFPYQTSVEELSSASSEPSPSSSVLSQPTIRPQERPQQTRELLDRLSSDRQAYHDAILSGLLDVLGRRAGRHRCRIPIYW